MQHNGLVCSFDTMHFTGHYILCSILQQLTCLPRTSTVVMDGAMLSTTLPSRLEQNLTTALQTCKLGVETASCLNISGPVPPHSESSLQRSLSDTVKADNWHSTLTHSVMFSLSFPIQLQSRIGPLGGSHFPTKPAMHS